MSGGKRSGAGRKPGIPNKEKKPNARGKVLHIRLSDAEHDEATLCADSLGESMSDFVRESIRLRCRKRPDNSPAIQRLARCNR